MEEVRTNMLAFDWGIGTPQALRRRTSSLMIQTTTGTPPYINSGKESSAFQAAWSQETPSLKAITFFLGSIRRARMAHLQKGLLISMGREEDTESEADK